MSRRPVKPNAGSLPGATGKTTSKYVTLLAPLLPWAYPPQIRQQVRMRHPACRVLATVFGEARVPEDMTSGHLRTLRVLGS